MATFGTGDEYESWSRSINELLDEMQSRSFVTFRDDGGVWKPHVNVYEVPDAYLVCVDLAGVKQDQIDVRCHGRNRVTISGLRQQPRIPSTSDTFSILAMEIDEGPFRRELTLPEDVDINAIEATYSKGFLWVTLPRTTSE